MSNNTECCIACKTSRGLRRTADGLDYHGEAFREALLMPCLDRMDRAILRRWESARQSQKKGSLTERSWLCDIAHRIAESCCHR